MTKRSPSGRNRWAGKPADSDGRRSVSRLFIAIVILVALAVAGIIHDHWMWRHRHAENISVFQEAAGGLGLGAIATPIWQFINYDIRIQPVDDSMTWPVPGGYSYGPDRTGTVSYFEETTTNEWRILGQ